MNSYHKAMLDASNNGKFPNLFDLWRNYHPEAIISDSDCQNQTDQNSFPFGNEKIIAKHEQ